MILLGLDLALPKFQKKNENLLLISAFLASSISGVKAAENANPAHFFSETSPDKLKDVIAALGTVQKAYPESVRARTQSEQWLTRLPMEQLNYLDKAIPSPWTGAPISFEAINVGVREYLAIS